MAKFFQLHLLIVLSLTENLLVTSSDVDLCYVFKNCKGKISSSRDSSSQNRALHNTFLNNTSDAHVPWLITLIRNPKTLTSVRDQIAPNFNGNTLNAGNGQNNEEKKSLSPQRFPYSRTFRPISQTQSNGLGYDRHLISRKDHRDDKFRMFPVISPPHLSPKVPTVDCHMNRCAYDRFKFNTVNRQNRHDRFVTVSDADTSRYPTLQEAREYLLKENAMNSRKNTKTFRFGKKSANTIGIDHWMWKPENQNYDRKPSMDFDLHRPAVRRKPAAGTRPLSLKEFLEQDPHLAQRFSRLPKDRPKFRYGKRIHKAMLQERPRREMSMTLKPFKPLYVT